jgi:hypothetical protein
MKKIFAIVLALASLGCLVSTALTVPIWDGNMASVYATVVDPFEIDFDVDGTLYCGHNSPTSGQASLYQILPGGGATAAWGSTIPQDPDGVHVFGGQVYASSEGIIWQAATPGGAMSAWATVPGSPNQSTIVVDEAGDYFPAGSVVVGNARFGTDIHVITPETKAVSGFVSNSSLYVTRALQFVNGTLYLTEIDATKGVWTVDSVGTPTQVADGGHNWDTPNAMVYESTTDTFLVGDETRLLRLPRGGGQVQVVGTGFGLINGLAFDSHGNLYVADGVDDVIWLIPRQLTVEGVSIVAATSSEPAKISMNVGNGLPNSNALLQASVDLGQSDPWQTILTVLLDSAGTASIVDAEDTRPIAVNAKKDFFRVVPE